MMRSFKMCGIVLLLCATLGCSEETLSIELDRSIRDECVAPSLTMDEATLEGVFPTGSNLFLALRLPASARASLAPLFEIVQAALTPHPNLYTSLGLDETQGDLFFALGGVIHNAPQISLEAGAYFTSTHIRPKAFIATVRERATALEIPLSAKAPWWILKDATTNKVLAFAPIGEEALQACFLFGDPPQQTRSAPAVPPWHEPWFTTLLSDPQARLVVHDCAFGNTLASWLPEALPFRALFCYCQTLQMGVSLKASTLVLQGSLTTGSEAEAQALYEGVVFFRSYLLQSLEAQQAPKEMVQALKACHLSMQDSTLFFTSELSIEALEAILKAGFEAVKRSIT